VDYGTLCKDFLFLSRYLNKFNDTKLQRRLFSLLLETPSNVVTQGGDVPGHILKPHYADESPKGFVTSLIQSRRNQAEGPIKSEGLVEKIRQACRVGRKVLNHVKLVVKVIIFYSKINRINLIKFTLLIKSSIFLKRHLSSAECYP